MSERASGESSKNVRQSQPARRRSGGGREARRRYRENSQHGVVGNSTDTSTSAPSGGASNGSERCEQWMRGERVLEVAALKRFLLAFEDVTQVVEVEPSRWGPRSGSNIRTQRRSIHFHVVDEAKLARDVRPSRTGLA